MISLNYHHLYYFWRTVKAGSIGQARRELLIAQPTLSLQLKELEKTFGSPLLNRTRKGVTLTPSGRVVFDSCEEIFTRGEALAALFGTGAAAPEPALRLGVEESVPRGCSARLLDFLHRGHRRVRVTLFGGSADELADQMRRHTLDLSISNAPLSALLGRGYVSRLKTRLAIRFVAAPRRAAGIERFPEDLKKAPLLLHRTDHPVRKDVEMFLTRRGVDAKADSELNDADLLRLLAIRGQGVSTLSGPEIEADIAQGRLVALDRGGSRLRQNLWMTSPRHRSADPRVAAALEDLYENYPLS